MSNRALAILTISALMLIFYSCGGDSPTGTNPDLITENSVVSGLVNALGDGGGIQDALLKLSKNDSILQETYSDENGEFSFTSVESGQYKVKMNLPQGYRESGTTSKTVQVENDVSIELEGEPIKEETATIRVGEQDTLTTSSGAFLSVNVSDATSDMEVTISEMVDQDEEGVFGTQPIKIQIRPSGASKSSISPAKRMLSSTSTKTASVNVSLGQKVKKTGSGSLVFNVESEDGIVSFYADPEQKTLADPKTKKESTYYTHSISTPPTIDTEFSFSFKRFDNSCDNKNRVLESVSSDDEGQIPLILVHGLQPTLGSCDDFDTFDPLNLDDEENNTFDGLVSKLQANSEINDKYRLYTYKYPTNAPIQEASDELWNQIDGNDQIQKPVILAHSMGGLVARKMVATEGDETIRGLITLGTMHYGTPIANTAEFISDSIEMSCLTNSITFLPVCLVDIFKGGILPNTPGLRDLRPHNVEENFDPLDVKKDKIYTLGGDLKSLKNISINNSKTAIATYSAGYSIMKSLDKPNDGLVPLSSAIPDCTDYRASLEEHDHGEIVNGNDFDFNSVFVHLQIILSLLAQDESFTPPSINTITSTPNPSNTAETVSFSADISGDEPIDCEWNFGDGATSTNCNTSYTYHSSGMFDISFTATNNGGTDTATLTHEVVQSVEEGLVAHYPFDGNTDDESKNPNDGSITGNVSFISGINGEAAKFGGLGDRGFITVSDDPSLTFDGQASFSMWARIDDSFGQTGSNCSGDGIDSANQIMIAKSGDRYGFILYGAVNEDGKVRLRSMVSETGISNSTFAGTSGQSEIEEGEWFHVVFILDQNGTYIYVNGDLLAKDDRPTDFRVANDEDMYLGIQKGKGSCLPYWWPLNGALDEVRIYNRSLSEEEIKNIYHN